MNALLPSALVALLLLLTSNAAAVPYVPLNDATPLERLAGGITPRERQIDIALREALAKDSNNMSLALRAAQRYVARARNESEPRLLGQAQAALSPWWSLPEPPIGVLLLRATIRQSNHDFTRSRSDLEQLVRRDPNNAQGWLTLATVQQVSGDLVAAEKSCQPLRTLASSLVFTTCLAGVNGLRGRASEAYDALSQAIAAANDGTSTDVGVRVWATTLQAELAERLGRLDDAQRAFQSSLKLDPSDTYTRAIYADYLIDRQRYNDVLAMIPATTTADVLLLRRAVAAKLAAAPDALKIEDALARRFAASSARGDRLHLREESRFALLIKNSAAEALALAHENWRVQKEPLDARILLEAALAAQQPQQAKALLEWLEANPLQGERITELVRRVRGAT
jgi:tetratricopeptide (TPR) repeat protein